MPVSTADTLVVPPGYVAEVLYAWGDPISDGPAFKPDASNSVDDQLRQAGMHHDGMRFFPLPAGQTGSTHGLLAVNHEYTDDGLLHPDGMLTWTAEKVRKSQAAHGMSVIEVRMHGNHWSLVRPSRYARRVTAATPMGLTGPAAGHAWMRTAADPAGRIVLGTMSNCAMGYTPWGTYLTCEENFQFYFVNRSEHVPALQQRYGITARGGGYRWHEFDERFDAARHPNEPNRFGWVVEIDPFDPSRPPVKRTALGRFKHEGAALRWRRIGRVAFYMGDDERFEYVYKFVSRDPATATRSSTARSTRPASTPTAPASGSSWLTGRTGSTRPPGSRARPRSASRRVWPGRSRGRRRWTARSGSRCTRTTGEAYCALTYNETRRPARAPGTGRGAIRARTNVYGHIIRWRERGGDPTATRFEWDVFILCGDPANADPARGDIKGDVFGSPDGLWVDGRGVLWIQTDVSTRLLHKGDYAGMGNNQMLAADPVDAGGAAVPHRPPRLRDHRRDRHAGRADDVREHPAPGGDAERAEQPGHREGHQRLAGRAERRATPLGHRGDPPRGRRARSEPRPASPPRASGRRSGPGRRRRPPCRPRRRCRSAARAPADPGSGAGWSA